MQPVDYRINIPLELMKLIEEYPNNSVGELLDSFTRPRFLNGKHLTDATDEEIYNALEKSRENESYLIPEDLLSEEEYLNWAEKILK